MALSKEFGDAVARLLGIDNTDGFVTRFLREWAKGEGSKATFNPLATTQTWQNTTNFNSVGVKNYDNFDDGVAATVKTLKNGRYQSIINAMRTRDFSDTTTLLSEFKTWGTAQGAGFARSITDGSFARNIGVTDSGDVGTTEQPPPDRDPYNLDPAAEGATSPASILDILQRLGRPDGSSVSGLLGDVSGIGTLGPGATEGLLSGGDPNFDKQRLESEAKSRAAGYEIEQYLARGESPPEGLVELVNYYQGNLPQSGAETRDLQDLIDTAMSVYQTGASVGAYSQSAAQSRLDNAIEVASKFPNLGEYTPGFGPQGALTALGGRSGGMKGVQVDFGDLGAPADAYTSAFEQVLSAGGASGIQEQIAGLQAQPQGQGQPPPRQEQQLPTNFPLTATPGAPYIPPVTAGTPVDVSPDDPRWGSGPIPQTPGRVPPQGPGSATAPGLSVIDKVRQMLGITGGQDQLSTQDTIKQVFNQTGPGAGISGDSFQQFWNLIRGN